MGLGMGRINPRVGLDHRTLDWKGWGYRARQSAGRTRPTGS